MKRFLLPSLLPLLLFSESAASDISNREILQRLHQLEQKVEQLERENRELKALLYKSKNYEVASRERTKKLQVEGRVLFRFSQAEDLDEGEKTVYGDSGNGFEVRKARVKFKGKLNDGFGYTIQLRADRGSNVELWDAYVNYMFDSVPLSVKAGMFKVPLSMSYLTSGTKLWFPDRPVAVRRVAPVWRDVGVAVTYAPLKNLKFTASVLNGEGWNNGKVYNKDKKYVYTFAVDAVPFDNDVYEWRIRAGYETGFDESSKLVYKDYGANRVKRNLIDVETALKVRPLGLAFKGGYLYDNPTDAKDKNGGSVSLGNAKGFYVQGDYAVPFDRNFHLVGRYSWVDPNDDKDDSKDVDYTTLGFYYLLNGWQAAVRSSYVWANERHGKEVDNNLFVTEFQLLF